METLNRHLQDANFKAAYKKALEKAKKGDVSELFGVLLSIVPDKSRELFANEEPTPRTPPYECLSPLLY